VCVFCLIIIYIWVCVWVCVYVFFLFWLIIIHIYVRVGVWEGVCALVMGGGGLCDSVGVGGWVCVYKIKTSTS
jgi:hypothetical protein